jgi:hypothetical protein
MSPFPVDKPGGKFIVSANSCYILPVSPICPYFRRFAKILILLNYKYALLQIPEIINKFVTGSCSAKVRCTSLVRQLVFPTEI